jgi:hypothetical protein
LCSRERVLIFQAESAAHCLSNSSAKDSRDKFTERTGTIMEGSHVPLHKWLEYARGKVLPIHGNNLRATAPFPSQHRRCVSPRQPCAPVALHG